jgi:tRNA G18 (ribose-2'-O)-methylase SpoU
MTLKVFNPRFASKVLPLPFQNNMKHRKLKNSELDRISSSKFKEVKKSPIIIILDNIRSLNNIGSVFRTADAFLIEKIYLCGITATPPHKDITKTALGATDSVSWEYFKSTLEVVSNLKKEGVTIVAIEQAEHSVSLLDFALQENNKYAFVFGNEVKGVAQDVVDASNVVVEIPQYGTKHSLNISVSTGVVIWDTFSKIKALTQ